MGGTIDQNADLLKEFEGLSPAQISWRPHRREWSIGENVHHLVTAN
ncbi:MAG: DinB family protein, partial [Fimbriimonadaceae bacterium]